jgi:DNA-binding MarR family transcriptional regulator
MENKKLGIALVVFCIFIAIIFFGFKNQIKQLNQGSCACDVMGEGGVCAAATTTLGIIDYVSIALIFSMLALGIYLIFFEKGQKAIISTLENHKKIQVEEEKFDILLKGLNKDEQKVIKAVKEQDGITQQTLRLRTDLHKSKLSIILDGLEKKGLIARKEKGKTKQVFLKVHI